MCGFIGGIGAIPDSFIYENIVGLERRGPDSHEVIKFPNGLIFGATRLAMTDNHPRSNQPMIDEVYENALVFNGEIYNYKILRSMLRKTGVIFKTESDTEVLLKLLNAIGEESLPLLEGMFAFAFYNKKLNSIILARDILGKKPLYYSFQSNRLVFSSSLNLVKKSQISTQVDPNSVYTYLNLGYVIDPHTIYSKIFAVQPGEVIRIDLNSLTIEKQFSFFPKAIINDDQQDIQSSLDAEILNRVDGHSNFAISLSGGLDSNIIALRSQRLGFRPTAYSIGFHNSDKSRYSEDSIVAKKVAKKLGFEFNLVEMPAGNFIPEILNKYVNAMEEPLSNPTGLSMMVLYAEMSKNGERLVLTGDGGDEIFGGYDRYLKSQKISFLPQLNNRLLKYLNNRHDLFPKKVQNFLISLSPGDSSQFWLYWHRINYEANIKKLYNFKGVPSKESNTFNELSKMFGSKSRVSELMIKDLSIWLSMESNRKLDRISMWNSIEARSPFQAERIIGLGYSKLKSSNYNILDKKILRDSIVDLRTLPIVNKKLGFISPLGHWLRLNPDLVFQSIQYLKQNTDFNKHELEKIMISFQKNNYQDFKLIWSLIVLSSWLRYSGDNIKHTGS
jgi:asparagine synthase (glutamine-hydrolysing)